MTTSRLDPHTDLDRGVLVATVGRFRRVATVGFALVNSSLLEYRPERGRSSRLRVIGRSTWCKPLEKETKKPKWEDGLPLLE